MLHLALWQPDIPQNTGNIARTCAATGTRLHLIGRLGFRINDTTLKRAGLDYWPHVDWKHHTDWDAFAAEVPASTWRFIETSGQAPYTAATYPEECCLILGSETRGLPQKLLSAHPEKVFYLPMTCPHVRSLNLATTAGIIIYHALYSSRATVTTGS